MGKPLSEHEPAHGLSQNEIFDLYCRLVALEQRLGEIETFAAELRPPFSEMAVDVSFQAADSTPARASALG